MDTVYSTVFATLAEVLYSFLTSPMKLSTRAGAASTAAAAPHTVVWQSLFCQAYCMTVQAPAYRLKACLSKFTGSETAWTKLSNILSHSWRHSTRNPEVYFFFFYWVAFHQRNCYYIIYIYSLEQRPDKLNLSSSPIALYIKWHDVRMNILKNCQELWYCSDKAP